MSSHPQYRDLQFESLYQSPILCSPKNPFCREAKRASTNPVRFGLCTIFSVFFSARDCTDCPRAECSAPRTRTWHFCAAPPGYSPALTSLLNSNSEFRIPKRFSVNPDKIFAITGLTEKNFEQSQCENELKLYSTNTPRFHARGSASGAGETFSFRHAQPKSECFIPDFGPSRPLRNPQTKFRTISMRKKNLSGGTIYLPPCLLLKWANYSVEYIPVAGGSSRSIKHH